MKNRLFVVSAVLLTLVFPTAVLASHSWGGYHWARTANPFTLKAHDNVSAAWETYVAGSAADWSQSNVLDVAVQWGSPLTNPRRCSSASGLIEVCNAKYGNNGWLGLAGIWITGGEHITKAYTKLNDTYFNTATYDTPAWRRLVACQEIAHDFGLDHQDETFDNANLGSCMDYTNDPDGGAGGAVNSDPSNEHPNQHDYAMIQDIYTHLDGTTTIASIFDAKAMSLSRPQSIEEILADAGQWGAPVRFNRDGLPIVFAMPMGGGDVVMTHVFWAPIDPFADVEVPGNDRNR